MKTYEELVQEYKKRQHDTVVDTIATGLTYVDEIAVDSGLLEETGLLTELTESVTGILPFMIISVSEGSKVLLGRKPGKTAILSGSSGRWRNPLNGSVNSGIMNKTRRVRRSGGGIPKRPGQRKHRKPSAFRQRTCCCCTGSKPMQIFCRLMRTISFTGRTELKEKQICVLFG